MSGWIKLHRKVSDNPIWLSEPFTRGQAWVDMILLANHADGYIRSNGKRVEILRGQLGWSELSLGKRWKWSRGKVKRFINELMRDQNIVQHIVQRSSVITICNYSEYQGDTKPDGTMVGTTDEQRTGQQTDNGQDTNKKKKNVKKEKKEPKSAFVLPDWINQELWDGFIAERKKLKASNSDAALKSLVTKLTKFRDQGFDPNESVANSLENSWKGVFEPKQKRGGTGKFNLSEALNNDMQRINEREMGDSPVCEVAGHIPGQVG